MITNIKKSITIVSLLLLTNIFHQQAFAEATQQNQPTQINQNLLMPNESVNSMTDIGKARSVYNLRNMKNMQSVEEKMETKEKTSNDEEIKLPPRTLKDDIIVHISHVKLSKSEVFSDTEIKKFESLLQNKDATAEDIRNLADIVEAVLKDNCFCVVGNEEKIEEQKNLFLETRAIF